MTALSATYPPPVTCSRAETRLRLIELVLPEVLKELQGAGLLAPLPEKLPSAAARRAVALSDAVLAEMDATTQAPEQPVEVEKASQPPGGHQTLVEALLKTPDVPKDIFVPTIKKGSRVIFENGGEFEVTQYCFLSHPKDGITVELKGKHIPKVR